MIIKKQSTQKVTMLIKFGKEEHIKELQKKE